MVLDFEELREGYSCRFIDKNPQPRAWQTKQEDGRAGEPNCLRAVDPVIDEVAHAKLHGRYHRGEGGE